MAAAPKEVSDAEADDAGVGGDEDAEMPDMAGLEAMMGGMGGGEGGDGMGGMDMSALMSMLGKGGGKGDMGGLGGMGGKGGMGGGKGAAGGGKEDDAEKSGGGGKWHWQQKGETIHVRVALDPPGTKKDVSVKFKVSSLSVVVRGETIIDGTLGGKVEVDDCTWCFSPDKTELQVMLTQVAGKTDAWSGLLA